MTGTEGMAEASGVAGRMSFLDRCLILWIFGAMGVAGGPILMFALAVLFFRVYAHVFITVLPTRFGLEGAAVEGGTRLQAFGDVRDEIRKRVAVVFG